MGMEKTSELSHRRLQSEGWIRKYSWIKLILQWTRETWFFKRLFNVLLKFLHIWMLEITNIGPKWVVLNCFVSYFYHYCTFNIYTVNASAECVIYAAVHRRIYCDVICKELKYNYKSSKGALLHECSYLRYYCRKHGLTCRWFSTPECNAA